MSYAVKEIYYTLQGEGAQSGRPAIFCRFTGCNLWSGLEKDRHKAICQFCDTDFVGVDGPGGGKFSTAQDLAISVKNYWPSKRGTPLVVCTGGEPLLQIDAALIDAFHDVNLEIAIETNGTILPPKGIDWICMSPKADAELQLTYGDEIKLVYPQTNASPDLYENMEFKHFFLQPMAVADPLQQEKNVQDTIRYCLDNPQWRLSLQTHKVLQIP